MVTFTTLAESKCSELLSQHSSAWPGSSTPTATAEIRSRSARSISLASLAASAGWEDDRHVAEVVPTAALAGSATSGTVADPSTTAATALVNACLGFIAVPSCQP